MKKKSINGRFNEEELELEQVFRIIKLTYNKFQEGKSAYKKFCEEKSTYIRFHEQ